MELNGIANIKLIIEMALEDKQIDKEVKEKVDEQLDILMDYMKHYKSMTTVKWQIKPWHEIREEYYARKDNNKISF